MRKHLTFILAFLLVCLASVGHSTAEPKIGITVAPHDQWNGWAAFNLNRLQALKDMKACGVVRLRIMGNLDMPGPMSTGVTPRMRDILAITKQALGLGFVEVVLALDGPFVGAYEGSPFYYPGYLVAKQYTVWDKELQKIKGNERVKFIPNDLESVQRLRALPTRAEAVSKAWEAQNVKERQFLGELPGQDLTRIPRYASEIMAATWDVNPDRRWLWQRMPVPLGWQDPRVETWTNFYPYLLHDPRLVGKLPWPCTYEEKLRICKENGVTGEWPDWNDFHHYDYSDAGLAAFFKETMPAEVTGFSEIGIPDDTPAETQLAFGLSLKRACEMMSYTWYIFTLRKVVWASKGINKKGLTALTQG